MTANSTLLTLAATAATASAVASPLSNGALTVTVDAVSGAIGTAEFLGIDYFNPGSPISDFGFLNGDDPTTFVRNTTTGLAGQPVVVSPTVASGVYTGGGANVGFQRRYSLAPGANALVVTTDFVNFGEAMTLTYFDTFDPDQGVGLGLGHETYNDVLDVFGRRAARASVAADALHTVVIGSMDPRSTVASGGPFELSSGSRVNTFFDSPTDGDGARADQGTHIGFRARLAAGSATSFRFVVAFGETPEDAARAFGFAVPEPNAGAAAALVAALASCVGRRGGAR